LAEASARSTYSTGVSSGQLVKGLATALGVAPFPSPAESGVKQPQLAQTFQFHCCLMLQPLLGVKSQPCLRVKSMRVWNIVAGTSGLPLPVHGGCDGGVPIGGGGDVGRCVKDDSTVPAQGGYVLLTLKLSEPV